MSPVSGTPTVICASVCGKTADEMDEERLESDAYQYLCHLEEARQWLGTILNGRELPPTGQFEEHLRNGVCLALLGHALSPDWVPLKRIFDVDESRFRERGLHFRHTDNINYFLQAIKNIGLPEIFTPETTDIYDRKNMPRVIFCIHALSLFLFKLGITPQIQDLYGKVTFTEAELQTAQTNLEEFGGPLPQFRQIGGMLNDSISSSPSKMKPMGTPKMGRSLADYEITIPELKPNKNHHFHSMVEDADEGPGFDVRSLIDFQARARGFLARQELYARLKPYYDQIERVIQAQRLWRSILIRRRFQALVYQVLQNRPRAPKIRPLAHFRPYERQIVAIQRSWRQYRINKDLLDLMKAREINLPLVRRFIHLLDTHALDFHQELLAQSLKGEITKAIRENQKLEKDLDTMDIKIGLLVKNRISVQDVVSHSKTLSSKKSSGGVQRKETFYLSGTLGESTLPRIGLKALKKESKERLDAYQHLFYLLQTNPHYLAKLIFVMPQMKTTKFLESVILTLYNFGTNPREEFLLLKLFKHALEEEVRVKVDKPSDIVTGQPLVLKMIVSFNRNGKGQANLRDMLGPLINRVLEDKTLQISTNPVEIYKQWVNQLEFDSGKSCGLSYDVTMDKALEHEEVRKRLERSITKLKQVSTLFLTTIVKAKAKMPFGMLFMAKVLYNALRKKFPQIHEKEILKVIGNLIYYRYINTAIVAPDSCDIVDINATDKAMNNEQRKNLGSIAKVLQFAASKKGFGEESAHLMCLNQYIIESHDKFKAFFADCCRVPEPEEEFAIDSYSEALLLAKPVIYITLAEICDTHQLLLDYRYQVASNEDDPIHELLDDLGERPSLCSLLGAADTESSDASLTHLSQTEVCLTLSNKFEVPLVDKLNMDRLFLKTKQQIMSILPCTHENNLLGCLKSRTTDEQSQKYWKIVKRKREADKIFENNKSMLDQTISFPDDDIRIPLDDCKHETLKNLQILERHGLVTIKDGFQAIINSIGKDIANQKAYRSRRRTDISRLKNTLSALEMKRQFFEDQIDYYHQYLKQCLANLNADPAKGKKKVRFHKAFGHSTSHTKNEKRLHSRQSIKYTGSKLHEKGILHTIQGLPANQFKNVVFEFTPKDEDGVFEVNVCFMGSKMESVEIDLQELLQLQYEGVAMMNMFGKARINVNLLLHMLNIKFYGRK
ncbi:ras GTPase-activating-like protein IQGAP1 [Tigriopus californicus]|nr:ras GTPase-activating-like protein IQGAP1 [Tigriopus californicus]